MEDETTSYAHSVIKYTIMLEDADTAEDALHSIRGLARNSRQLAAVKLTEIGQKVHGENFDPEELHDLMVRAEGGL